MKNRMAVLFLFGVLVVGCKDGEWSKWEALGEPAHVSCYSGGRLIYDGWSTGAITNEGNSDGYFFKDKKTGHLVRISGDCVVIDEPEPKEDAK